MPPTLAARWTTISAPSNAWRVAARSRRSCSDDRVADTDAPRSSSAATVGRPRKPAPPVTTTRLPDQKPGSGCGEPTGPGYPRQTLRALAAVALTRVAPLRICIDARIPGGTFGGVEQV